MNNEIRDMWVAALRSGKYKQGDGWLRMDDEFCCLGVLCDLAVQHGIVEVTPYSVSRGTEPVHAYRYDDRVSTLPRSVVEWSGLPGDCGPLSWEVDGKVVDLISLNDNGVPFTVIADEIEARA